MNDYRHLPKPVVIVADDLTGACDCALQFRRRRARALVHVDSAALREPPNDVHAFSTDSRNLEPSRTASRIQQIAQQILPRAVEPPLIFKKIDSLLRGNPGPEIMAAMDAFGAGLGVIAPAFPEMGRTIVDGRLSVRANYTWEPIELPRFLRNQGLTECRHIHPGAIADAIAGGATLISVDTACHEDFRIIITEVLCCGRKTLWAGSGGLASALATELVPQPMPKALRPVGARPVLFCVGSQHSATAAQLEKLKRDRPLCDFTVHTATGPALTSALEQGRHAILRLDVADPDAHRVRDLLLGVAGRTEAIFISGGDTVSVFCRAV
ncbi:MAG: four-carbon acid sugar kinase family protein [Acidobacteriaceae bacterium]|nr:four-carbon acid sugar kinase family protein [Acidobacteriaceae bacterium]